MKWLINWLFKKKEPELMLVEEAKKELAITKDVIKAKNIKYIMKEIKFAIQRGHDSFCDTKGTFDDGVDEFYKEMGYTVTYNNDTGYVMISWKNQLK